MRQRFKTSMLCTSANYGVSHRVHLKTLEENHNAFEGSNLQRMALTNRDYRPNDMVTVIICGKNISVPYCIAKGAGYKIL